MSKRLSTFKKTDLTIEPFQFEELVHDLIIDLDSDLSADTHPIIVEDGIHKTSIRYKSATGTVEFGIAIDEHEVDEVGYAEIHLDGSDFNNEEEDLFQDLLCYIEDVLVTLC